MFVSFFNLVNPFSGIIQFGKMIFCIEIVVVSSRGFSADNKHGVQLSKKDWIEFCVHFCVTSYGLALELFGFVCSFNLVNSLTGVIQFGKIIFESNCRLFRVRLSYYFISNGQCRNV